MAKTMTKIIRGRRRYFPPVLNKKELFYAAGFILILLFIALLAEIKH